VHGNQQQTSRNSKKDKTKERVMIGTKKYELWVDGRGTKRYCLDEKYHREDGPAIEWSDGYKVWYLNGNRHREDGPAIEYADGGKEWWVNGERHREDGPAVELANGDKEWWVNGERHREDGPAIAFNSGYKVWWIDGKRLTEVEFNARKSSCPDGETITVRGKKYRLVEELVQT